MERPSVKSSTAAQCSRFNSSTCGRGCLERPYLETPWLDIRSRGPRTGEDFNQACGSMPYHISISLLASVFTGATKGCSRLDLRNSL